MVRIIFGAAYELSVRFTRSSEPLKKKDLFLWAKTKLPLLGNNVNGGEMLGWMFLYLEFYDFNDHYLNPCNKSTTEANLVLQLSFFFLQYLLSDNAEQQLRFVKNGKKQPVIL